MTGWLGWLHVPIYRTRLTRNVLIHNQTLGATSTYLYL